MTCKKITASGQIIVAFMDLLSEKPFIDITISELVKKAGVARASFYRNFNTTKDVFDSFINDVVNSLSKIANPVIKHKDDKTWRNFLFQYIYFLDSSDKNYLNIKKENITIVFDSFIEKVREIRNNLLPFDLQDEYNLSAKLATTNGVILVWKERGMKESVEEIVNYLMTIISKF